MTKWEYFILRGEDAGDNYEQLDALGSMGWELVGVSRHTAFKAAVVFYFKRPITDAS